MAFPQELRFILIHACFADIMIKTFRTMMTDAINILTTAPALVLDSKRFQAVIPQLLNISLSRIAVLAYVEVGASFVNTMVP